MKILFSIAVMASAILAAQPILFTSSVEAQAYGSGAYGDLRYNTSPTDSDSGDKPDSGTTPDSNGASNDITYTTEVSDDPNELQQDSTPIDEQNSSQDNNETTDVPDDEESDEERQSDIVSISSVNWIALGALVAALLFFISAIVRKRRKQQP